jgi:hypothetical protein
MAIYPGRNGIAMRINLPTVSSCESSVNYCHAKASRQWHELARRIALCRRWAICTRAFGVVREARRRVGRKGKWLSVFTSTQQFGERDLSAIRGFERDLKLCRSATADVVFAPTMQIIGKVRRAIQTYVVEELLSQSMEGASRPLTSRRDNHCCKGSISSAGRGVFAPKIISRRCGETHGYRFELSLKNHRAPTVREKDGVAMSSRNKYLIGNLRRQATVLRRQSIQFEKWWRMGKTHLVGKTEITSATACAQQS